MLMLERKLNEQIVIGDNVVITVVDIRNGVVKLGINAPLTVPVHRKEIADELHGRKFTLAQAARIKKEEQHE